jgi:ABC-type transporter Mla subunit MlaD
MVTDASKSNKQDSSEPGKKNDADFDLFSLFQGPANVMSGVIGMADNGRKAVSGIMDTIASLQRAAKALEQLATRVERLVSDIEAPLRIITPELEKAAERMVRLAELVEGPVDRLLPGLDRAIDTLDRVALSQLPDNLDQLRHQVGAVVDIFAELPKRFSGLAQFVPGLDRLTALARPAAPVADRMVAPVTVIAAPDQTQSKSAKSKSTKPKSKTKKTPKKPAASSATKKAAKKK